MLRDAWSALGTLLLSRGLAAFLALGGIIRLPQHVLVQVAPASDPQDRDDDAGDGKADNGNDGNLELDHGPNLPPVWW